MKSYAIIAIVALGLIAHANAECANACSGHGTCEQDDECKCFPNWMANDCSERVCPYGLAFVDSPNGDLNHDTTRSTGATLVNTMRSNAGEWETYPVLATAGDYTGATLARDDSAHFYAECSNRGMCDRASGTCQCFDGYTGSSCQRTVCPNDCSGHGVCRTVQEIAEGGLNYKITDNAGGEKFWEGVSLEDAVGQSIKYRLWDADKSQSCVCDPGYSGPDCSRRECPRGDDPLTHRRRECGGLECRDELQTIVMPTAGTPGDVDWVYLTFTDWTGEMWRTDVFTLGANSLSGCVGAYDGLDGVLPDPEASIAAAIEAQLEAIPNAALADVTVTVTTLDADDLTFTVQFDSNQGNQGTLAVVAPASLQTRPHPHCTPGIGPLVLVDGAGDSATGTPAEHLVIVDSSSGGSVTIPVGSLVSVRYDAPAADVDGYGGKYTVIDSGSDTVTVSRAQAFTDPGAGFVYVASTAQAATAEYDATITAAKTATGNREESTCSNRGLCDYETGLCRCFRGYYKDDCSTQNALAGSFTAAL